MIKLCRVEGIDRTNTPLFDNFQEQYDYFDEKVVLEYDTFFPPLFSKEMEITANTDLIRSGANYVILEMIFGSSYLSGNRYFYFITDMIYISENVYRLTLEMDTIQTYMFSVKYHSGNIKRKLINRWTTGSIINRNYIREDYSSGNYINKDYTVYDNEYDGGWLVLKFPSNSSSFKSWNSRVLYNSAYTGEYLKTMNDGTSIVLIPAGIYNSNLYKRYLRSGQRIPEIYIWLNPKYSLNLIQLDTIIREYSEKPDLIDMYYIPFNPFTNISITHDEEIVNIDGEVTMLNIRYNINQNNGDEFLFLGDNKTILGFNTATIGMKYIEKDFGFNYRNTQLGVPFDYRNVPQLIDENYMEFTFGEKLSATGYPLSKLKHIKIQGYYMCDILSGFRAYRLCQYGYNIEDVYQTLCVINTKEQATIYNDAWKTYAAQNMGSLTLGRAFSLGKSLYGLSRKKRTPKRHKISQSQIRAGIGVASEIVDYASEDLNKMFTPDTVTQGNTYSSDVMNNSLSVISTLNVVSNIEDVAKIYESKGYAVNEIITNSPLDNLTRYYYNYFEIDDLDISGDILIPFDHLDNIKERWSEGIRLYTMKHLPNDMELGDVCKYDNVELSDITE